MRLRKLSATNFGPFESLNIAFDEDDAYLVIGENGAGKSTLVEAIFWCCAGEGVREVSAADVVRDGQSSTVVTVTFEFPDGLLVVERKWTKSAKTLRFTTPDGNTQTFHTAAEGTKALFEWLGFDKALLSLVVFFGKRFNAFSRMKPAARADLVDRLIGASRWLDASDKAGKVANSYDNTANRLLSTLESLQTTKQDWQDMVAELQEQLAAEKGRKKAQTAAAKQDHEQAQEAVDRAQQKWQKADTKLNGLCDELEDFVKWLQKTERKLSADRDKLAALKKVLAEAVSTTCPTCQEPLSKQAIAKLRKQRADQQQEAEDLQAAIDKLQDKQQQTALDLVDIKQEVETAQKTAREAQQALADARASETASKKVLEQATALQTEVSHLQGSLDKAQLSLEQTLEKETALTADLTEAQHLAEKARYWKTGFKHVHSYLMNKALQILQEWTNHYAQALGFNGGKICISPWKENQSGALKTEVTLTTEADGFVHSIGALSDGQTQRVDLACFLAFGDLVRVLQGVDLQFRVLDEPLAHLDDTGKYAVFQLLKDLPTVGQRVVIDHDAHFRDQFTRKFVVTRTDGISTLTQE